MKRNQLKDLGLDENQIKAVMDLNGEDINNAKSGNNAIVEETHIAENIKFKGDKAYFANNFYMSYLV